jgi:hypothetical protein
MKSDAKPVAVTLKNRSVENPEQPMVKPSDQLDDEALDQVSGGGGVIINSKALGTQTTTEIDMVRLPAGVGSFHPGAWAT